MHDGTVRDVCFIEDMSNKSSLLVSGGAGDCKIYVTDCATGVPFQALSGHTGQPEPRDSEGAGRGSEGSEKVREGQKGSNGGVLTDPIYLLSDWVRESYGVGQSWMGSAGIVGGR